MERWWVKGVVGLCWLVRLIKGLTLTPTLYVQYTTHTLPIRSYGADIRHAHTQYFIHSAALIQRIPHSQSLQASNCFPIVYKQQSTTNNRSPQPMHTNDNG